MSVIVCLTRSLVSSGLVLSVLVWSGQFYIPVCLITGLPHYPGFHHYMSPSQCNRTAPARLQQCRVFPITYPLWTGMGRPSHAIIYELILPIR